MICNRCQVEIPAARERAILQLRLNERCVPCQSKVERRNPTKPELTEKAMACGSAYDSTEEHFAARQGNL